MAELETRPELSETDALRDHLARAQAELAW